MVHRGLSSSHSRIAARRTRWCKLALGEAVSESQEMWTWFGTFLGSTVLQHDPGRIMAICGSHQIFSRICSRALVRCRLLGRFFALSPRSAATISASNVFRTKPEATNRFRSSPLSSDLAPCRANWTCHLPVHTAAAR